MGQCVAPCYDGLDAMLFRHLPKVPQMKLSELMSDDGKVCGHVAAKYG